MQKMNIDKKQILNMNKAANRAIDIEDGFNLNYHRVFKNKAKYDRKVSKKLTKEAY